MVGPYLGDCCCCCCAGSACLRAWILATEQHWAKTRGVSIPPKRGVR